MLSDIDTTKENDVQATIEFSAPSLSVFKNHYLKKNPDGALIEKTPDDVFMRLYEFYVAHGVPPETAEKMRKLQSTKQFGFNSPVYYNADVSNTRPQLSACFVGNLQDSMESITDHIKRACKIFQSGAGLGFNSGMLRPRGASVGDGGLTKSGPSGSSGPLSFLELFQSAGNTVMSAGKRRAAMWTGMRYDHPDAPEFIQCKRGAGREKYTNMNISLIVDDAFYETWQKDEVVHFNWNGNSSGWGSAKARDLMVLISKSVWMGGDPGLMFVDVINRHNTTPTYGRIVCFNPCVTGDTLVSTVDGLVPISVLAEFGAVDLYTGSGKRTSGYAFCSGFKPVYEVTFNDGRILKCTHNHKLVTPDGKVPLEELEVGDYVITAPFGPEHVVEVAETGVSVIKSIMYLGEEHVYDITVEHDEHTFIANGLSISNCGEIALPPDSVCNLGAVVVYNVIRFLEVEGLIHRNPNTCTFDWRDCRDEILTHINYVATIGMEHLDKNVDVSCYPDDLFAENAKKIRPTGLGLSGLGEAFCALGVRYGSPEAIKIGAEIMNEITYAAGKWSFEAAAKHGACAASMPLENAEAMKAQILFYADRCEHYGFNSKSAARWRTLAKRCQPGAYRNAYWTCIAPTGNTGIAFDSGSGGMEPIPGVAYRRNTRDGVLYFADQEFEMQVVPTASLLEDICDAFSGSIVHAMRNYKNAEAFLDSLDTATVDFLNEKYEDSSESWKPRIKETWEKLRKLPETTINNFVMMHDIPWEDRIAQQEGLQSFTSLSISSTINVPHDTAVEEIQKIYVAAMASGHLKGITLYRDGSIQWAPMTMTKDTKDALPDTMPSQDTAKLPVPKAASQNDDRVNNGATARLAIKTNAYSKAGDTEYGTVVVRKKTKRPVRTEGFTVEIPFTDGIHNDNFYVTINEDPNNPGRPIEIFVAGGRHGENTPAMNQALGRLVSGLLQEGIPVQSIVKKLIGIKGDYRALARFDEDDERPTQVLSVPDAIGKLLQRHYIDKRQILSVPNGVMCPECYHNTLVYGADGKKCWKCHNPDCGHYLC